MEGEKKDREGTGKVYKMGIRGRKVYRTIYRGIWLGRSRKGRRREEGLG